MLVEGILGQNWWETEKDFEKAVFSVLWRFYDKNLFEQGLARTLNRLLTEKHSYSLDLPSTADEAFLADLLAKYKRREFKQTILLDNFTQIVNAIQEDDYQQTALRVILDILISKEHSRKHYKYEPTSNHRDG